MSRWLFSVAGIRWERKRYFGSSQFRASDLESRTTFQSFIKYAGHQSSAKPMEAVDLNISLSLS